MALVFDIKTNIDSKAVVGANAALAKYMQTATGAAAKTDKFGAAQKALKSATDSLKTSIGKMSGALSSMTLVTGGVGLSLKGMVTGAFNAMKEIMNMRAELKNLSDSSGNVSAAWNVMMGAWSNSIASLATVKGSMNALANSGVRVGPAMENLATFISNINQASGLSVEKLGQLTGELNSYWGVSVKGSREVVSSILAAQKAFGSTTAEMEQFMGTIIEAQNKIGALAKDGEASAKALAQGITRASGAMRSFGISAQKATGFLEKLLDPERFDETSGLLRRLGITVEEQFKAMETAGGKEMFFDKILEGLPKLSKELQTISNPLARYRYAKGIGLDPEIAMKMASANAGQMATLAAEYKNKMKDETAAKEKQRMAQADAARFDDQIRFLKFKILGPMIQFVQEALSKMPVKQISNIMRSIVQFFATGFTKMLHAFQPILDVVSGDSTKKMSDVIGPVIGNMVKVLLDAIKANMPVIMGILKEVMKGAIGLFIALFKEHPILMSAAFGGKALGMAGNAMGFARGMGFKMPGIGGMLGGVGSIAKAAGPIGLILAALTGGIAGAGSMDAAARKQGITHATFGERMGGAAAGGLTLGIAPLIDKIFGTEITPSLGKNMKNILLVNPLTAPAGLMLHAMEYFSDSSLTITEQQDKEMLEKKMMLNQKLTKDEEKRAAKLNKIMEANHKTFAQSMTAVWDDIKNLPERLFDSVKSGWNKLRDMIGKIAEWWDEKVSLPLQANMSEMWNAILNAAPDWLKTAFDIDPARIKADKEAWEAFNTARAKGYSGIAQIQDYANHSQSTMTQGGADQLQALARIQLRMLERQQKETQEEEQKANELRKKQLEEAKKQTGSGAGINANTKALVEEASKKTTETTFFKEFVGNYGFTSLAGRTA